MIDNDDSSAEGYVGREITRGLGGGRGAKKVLTVTEN